MESFKFWKKLNSIIKSKEPEESARRMIASGEITTDELSWALVALATMPLAIMDTLEKR